MNKALSIGTAGWVARKVTNIATSQREWIALHTCDGLLLKHNIFSPFSAGPVLSERERERVSHLVHRTIGKAGFNEAQMSATKHCLMGDGFKLVNGPPGTGFAGFSPFHNIFLFFRLTHRGDRKTRTILGILSSLLASASDSVRYASSSSLVENSLHVLVCAPSNAAVDEVALRILRNGLWDSTGAVYRPTLLRLGATASTEKELLEVSFDSRLAKELQTSTIYRKELNTFTENSSSIERVTAQARHLEQDISRLNAELDEKRKLKEDETDTKRQLTELITRRRDLGDRIKQLRTISSSRSRHMEEARKKVTAGLLSRTQIICCTLSTSGSEVFGKLTHGFDTVLIDEAAQAVELSTLIPLRYNVKRCILVGDPAQLPATVLSRDAADCLYEQSLFQRLKECKHQVALLDTQYRMHPQISRFPSEHFYEGRLSNAPNTLCADYTRPHHSIPAFAPFVFFDLGWTSEQRGATNSTMNSDEARFCCGLVSAFLARFPGDAATSDIGVITPYQQQVSELKRFSRITALSNVEISTIDGFQGREKGIVVFSCVRAPVAKSIGFLADVRRMNVGITRAKYSLWVVGNSTLLSSNNDWRGLISHARNTGSCECPFFDCTFVFSQQSL